ncbi:hypothetical protein [Citrobacter freundii]
MPSLWTRTAGSRLRTNVVSLYRNRNRPVNAQASKFETYTRLTTVAYVQSKRLKRPNIGLINSCPGGRKQTNEYDFETPYRKVTDGVVTDQTYLSAIEEGTTLSLRKNIQPDDEGHFVKIWLPAVAKANCLFPVKNIDQHGRSAPAGGIRWCVPDPCLEHDDANQALMGANM